jgi:hypothetical protein
MTARVHGEGPKVLERVLEGGILGHERITYATVTGEQEKTPQNGKSQGETRKLEL